MEAHKVNERYLRHHKAPVQSAEFEPLMKIPEAAKILGLAAPTLYRWVETGKFEALRIGGKSRRVRLSVVRAFLDAAQKAATLRTAY